MDPQQSTLSFQQKEKAQAQLYSLYAQAMQCLKRQNAKQGIKNFEQILASPHIWEVELRKLRKSVLFSLGNVMCFTQQYDFALGYFYEGVKVEREIVSEEQEIFNPNTTRSIEYTTLLRMYELTNKLGYREQSIYLLKKALVVCPDLWRSRIVSKLELEYQKQGLALQQADLIKTYKNPSLFQIIIDEERGKRYHHLSQRQGDIEQESEFLIEAQKYSQEPLSHKPLRKMQIYIEDKSLQYCHFQYLLTACYVLLKCQRKRNFNRKRYLHKKYESSNNQWHQFLEEYDPIHTKIQLIFERKKETTNQAPVPNPQKAVSRGQEAEPIEIPSQEEPKQEIEQEHNSQPKKGAELIGKEARMIEELTAELLRIKYAKKKKSKATSESTNGNKGDPQSQAAEKTDGNEVVGPSSFNKNKKNSLQQKSCYDSLKSYFTESCERFKLPTEELKWLQHLDSEAYQAVIYKGTLEPEKERIQDENEEEDDLSNNVSQGLKQPLESERDRFTEKEDKERSRKLTFKEKKERKEQKVKNFNELFEKFLLHQATQWPKVSSINTDSQSDCKAVQFGNVCDLVESCVDWVLQLPEKRCIKRVQSEHSRDCIWSEPSVKKLIAKCILKIMPLFGGYFAKYTPSSANRSQLSASKVYFMDILVSHFLFMSQKPDKSSEFAPHERQKCKYLSHQLSESFQPTVYLFSQPPKTDIRFSSVICGWSKQLIRFYMSKPILNMGQADLYKEVAVSHNKEALGQWSRIDGFTCNLQTDLPPKVYYELLMESTPFAIESLMVEMSNLLQSEDADIVVPFVPKSSSEDDLDSLLKVLQRQNLQQTDSAICPENANEGSYVFQKLSDILFRYFTKLEEDSNTMEEFSLKFLEHTTEKMKVAKIINSLYGKFISSSSTMAKLFEKCSAHRQFQVLFQFIKLTLLSPFPTNDDCLRIMFFLTNTIFKGFTDLQKTRQQALSKTIVVFHALIEYSENRQCLENRSTALKKLYQNVISKNISLLFCEEHFSLWKVENEHRRKQKRAKSSYDPVKKHAILEDPRLEESGAEGNMQRMEIITVVDKVMDIINGIYFGTDFMPKKLEDSLGFFLFLSKNYSEEFRCEELELAPTVIKVFRRCYQVFNQKLKESLNYCSTYQHFLKKIDLVFDGQEKESPLFTKVMKGEQKICECCSASEINKKFNYKEVVFILARFFQFYPQAQTNAEQTANAASKGIAPEPTDEKYYKECLLLDLGNHESWINFIRVNCRKAYLYFDSIVDPQPFEAYKNKFLFSKRLINFIKASVLEESDSASNSAGSHLLSKSQKNELRQYAIQSLNILNVLKVKEREFSMVMRKLETNFSPKDSQEVVKKYQEGLKMISSKYTSLSSVASVYLGLVELVMVEIRLTELSPSKLQALLKLNKRIKHVVHKDLERCEKETDEYAVHLEQDFVVQAYILNCKTVEKIVEKTLRAMANLAKQRQSESVSQEYSKTQAELKEFVSFLSELTSPENQVARQEKYKVNFSSEGNEQKQVSRPIQLEGEQGDILADESIEEEIYKYTERYKNVEPSREEPRENDQSEKVDSGSVQSVSQEEYSSAQRPKQFTFKPLENNPEKMDEEEKGGSLQKLGSSSEKSHKKPGVAQVDIESYFERELQKQLSLSAESPIGILKTSEEERSQLERILNLSSCYFNAISKLFLSLPRFQQNKFKFRRSVTASLQYVSSMNLKYNSNPSVALDIIKDYFNIRVDDIVFVYSHSREKVSTEKNAKLSEFYNRSLVHNLHRLSFIQHLINCFVKVDNIESLVVLNRKIMKVMTVCENTGTITNKLEGSQEIKYLQMMYWVGVDSFVDMVEKIAVNHRLEDRYTKILVEFKNRLKRSVENNCQDKIAQKADELSANAQKQLKENALKQNYYYCRIDAFIKDYEKKYECKLKLKKTKKEREMEKEKMQEKVDRPESEDKDKKNIDSCQQLKGDEPEKSADPKQQEEGIQLCDWAPVTEKGGPYQNLKDQNQKKNLVSVVDLSRTGKKQGVQGSEEGPSISARIYIPPSSAKLTAEKLPAKLQTDSVSDPSTKLMHQSGLQVNQNKEVKKPEIDPEKIYIIKSTNSKKKLKESDIIEISSSSEEQDQKPQPKGQTRSLKKFQEGVKQGESDQKGEQIEIIRKKQKQDQQMS